MTIHWFYAMSVLLKNIAVVLPSQPETVVAHYHTIVISCGALFVNQYQFWEEKYDSCTQREKEQEKVALQMEELSKICTTKNTVVLHSSLSALSAWARK